MLELCDTMIHKTELHVRDAAEYALKFNDLLLSFLCHSQPIKLINRIICNVYFNNFRDIIIIKFDEKYTVAEQFKQIRQRKRRRT